MEKICAFCGKTFTVSDKKDIVKRQKYCSLQCWSKGYRASNPDKIKVYTENAIKARRLACKCVCRRCGKSIPPEGRKPGTSYCSRECYSTARKERERERKRQHKLVVFEMLGGAKCKYCGCDDINALEINHINGGGNRERRLKRGKPYSGNVILEDLYYGITPLSEVEVTCRVCNAWHYITRKIGYDKWEIKWKP